MRQIAPGCAKGGSHRSLAELAAALLQLGAVATPAPPPPAAVEAVVQRQVDAYNRGDVQAFANAYTDDVELYELGDKGATPYVSGRAALIAEYAPMFAKFKPQAAILSRITSGEFVTDREQVTFGTRSMTAIAIYQVKAGRIRRVWFVP